MGSALDSLVLISLIGATQELLSLTLSVLWLLVFHCFSLCCCPCRCRSRCGCGRGRGGGGGGLAAVVVAVVVVVVAVAVAVAAAGGGGGGVAAAVAAYVAIRPHPQPHPPSGWLLRNGCGVEWVDCDATTLAELENMIDATQLMGQSRGGIYSAHVLCTCECCFGKQNERSVE